MTNLMKNLTTTQKCVVCALLGFLVYYVYTKYFSVQGFDNSTEKVVEEVVPVDMNSSKNLPVEGYNRTPNSCFPQNTLKPEDLLPSGKSKEATDFDNANPTGEGILKGVNFLDAGFHVGVNTVGQSLRNANRQLRSEPPNPQVAVSPWLNTTIGPDLGRKPLEDEDVCLKGLPTPNAALEQIGTVSK